MSRLPFVTEADLTEAQRRVWDDLGNRRPAGTASLLNDRGGLIGPFNAMVTAPVVGGPMARLGGAVRFQTSLDRRLQELAIITVGAHFKADFEFWAHSRMAVEAGLPQAVADALAAGREPQFAADDEATVHRFATQLLTSGRADDATYAAVRDLVGDVGLVELVVTIGYYALVSLTLDAFAVELPEGVDRYWPA